MSDVASTQLGAAIVSDTFRNLVQQFSQELCFYRELIQNAIDAGSRTVEVVVEYTERGVAVAHVIDAGCGMDRKTIDSQLTRLFSSTKEGDFTKIGKFGIGFVSVFSVDPQAVVVDTGHGGEYWRVLFTPDGSFDRIELGTPVEGTHVQVYKEMAAHEFPDFLARSRATVEYWCRHAEAEITFNGERVDVPFDLDTPLKVHSQMQGTEIVAALTLDEAPFFGFYNGGITLLEGRKAWIPGVAFKIKSRYLEHTLTRDNVKQDENFDKAMRLLGTVVHTDLAKALREALIASAAVPASDGHRRDVLESACRQLERLPRDAPFLPRLGGPAVSLGDLDSIVRRTRKLLDRLGVDAPEKSVFVDDEANHVVAAIERSGVVVLRAARTDPLRDLLQAAGWRPLRANEVVGLPVDAEPPEHMRALAAATHVILRDCGVSLSDVRFGRFGYPGSCISDRPFIVQLEPGLPCSPRPCALLGEDRAPSLRTSFFKQHVVLNVSHPLLAKMTSPTHRALGPYLLAKLLCLADGLHPETERRLLASALRIQ